MNARRTNLEHKKIENLMNNSYKYVQGVTTNPPVLCPKKFNLTCQNYKINNTPYHVIKGPQFQQLIKDEPVTTVAPFTHNGSIDFNHTLQRPDFIDIKKAPHDGRFELLDTYDKSSYLSTVKRPKCNIEFKGYGSRDKDIILKGGSYCKDLKGSPDHFYDPKKDFTMRRVDHSITKFGGQAGKVRHNSIYSQNEVPDNINNVKVAEIERKYCKPKVKAPVNLKKQLGRVQTTKNQAQRNIETENSRQDYIKRLLNEENDNFDLEEYEKKKGKRTVKNIVAHQSEIEN